MNRGRASKRVFQDFFEKSIVINLCIHSLHKIRLLRASCGLHEINTGRPRLAVGPRIEGVLSGQYLMQLHCTSVRSKRHRPDATVS